MPKNNAKILFIILILLLLLTACGRRQTTSPETVVQQYISALVSKDNTSAVNLSCAAWEANADAEGAAFEGVEVSQEDVACHLVGQGDQTATVACQGKILFSYAGGENDVIDLSLRSYSLVFEGGVWRMCGYK